MTDTFCVQPWFAFDSQRGGNNICKWMTVDADIEKVKSDLLAGIKTSACQKCWDAESNNARSRRKQQNLVVDHLLDLSIENIEKLVRENKHSVILYEIATNSICNAACIMCIPGLSSKWATLLKQKQRVFDNITDDILAKIDYKTARSVEFLGGEPFLDHKVILILKKLLEHGNNECNLSFVINGTINMSNDLFEVVSQFKNVNISFSIDGIGKVFEYQRWPLSWDKFLENLKIFQNSNFDLSMHLALTNINLPYLDETKKWIESQNLRYYITEVTDPPFFNPRTPISEETIQELDRQDALKGINRKDYLGW